MHEDAIARLHAEHREPGFGTLAVDELVQVDRLIAEERPRSFVEVGTASGLSAGLIAQMLDDHGGERLLTLDLSNTFYADPSRATGFVLPRVYPGGRVAVEQRTGVTALDLLEHDETFDMALVDAGHVHPWPLLDTLAVNVVLRGRRTVIQHDLTLFRRQGNGRAVGPKHLYDQFPATHRTRFDANGGNLFSVSLDLPPEHLEAIAIDAFNLPWTLTKRIPDDVVEGVRAMLARHYGAQLQSAFDKACGFFNRPHARYFRQPRPDAS